MVRLPSRRPSMQRRARLRLSAAFLSAVLVVPIAATGSVVQAEGPNAIITAAGCQATDLPANDDGSSPLVAMPFSIDFFGNQYGSLYVNNNGNVTFDDPLAEFTPSPLVSNATPIIAPFWADVDTTGAASGTTHYGSISAGETQIGGRPAFCVNWLNVGYFASHDDLLNSFQLVLVDRSDTGAGNFDIVFNYDKVQWETGDASGGTGGLGGSPARVGYSNGSSASFELPGSATAGAFLDSNANTGLIHNNVGAALQDGRYVFPVRNGAATGHSISGHIWANTVGTPAAGAFIAACPTPADTSCRLTASNASGGYVLNNLPDSTSGGGAVDHTWSLTVNPPGGSGLSGGSAGPVSVAGSDVAGIDVTLHGPTPMPPGVTLTTPSNGSATSGVPSIYWQDPVTVQIAGCTGGTGTATFQVEDGYSQTVSLVELPSGTWTAVFAAPYPHHGNATISWTISCGTSGSFNLYIDPSGVVNTIGGSPIAGATVTLFRSDNPGGPFVQVPNGSAIMSPGNQTNPDLTNATGHFGWDVLAGYYKVRAEKAGCTAPGGGAFVESAVLPIPPPVTDLDLRLDCGDVPAVNVVKFVNGVDADSPTGPHVPAGSTVTFTYVVTNTGNVPLGNVVVTDDKLGPIAGPASGDANSNGLLDPTETWTYTTTATGLAGQQTNLGTVTGRDPNTGATVTDDDPANYFGDAPAVNIVKFVNGQDADSPTGPHVPAGSTLTFTYVVTNTGNVALANVAVTDDELGPITSFTGDTNGNGLLDPTETWTYTPRPPPWPASRPTSARSPARTPTTRPAPPSPTTTRPTTSAMASRRSRSSSSSTALTPTARPDRTCPPAAR